MGLTEDRGRSVESTGAIAAHELGHIFNMNHDDSPSEWVEGGVFDYMSNVLWQECIYVTCAQG